MTREETMRLFVAVYTIDPNVWTDYRLAGDAMEHTVHTAGDEPRAWYPSFSEALLAYANELKSEAEETDRKSNESIALITRALPEK